MAFWRIFVDAFLLSKVSLKEKGRAEKKRVISILLVLASFIAQLVKNLPAMQEDPGLIPELGRSPGEGIDYPLQYSGLETVRGVTKSRTQMSDFHF